jgi:hypothetical protein
VLTSAVSVAYYLIRVGVIPHQGDNINPKPCWIDEKNATDDSVGGTQLHLWPDTAVETPFWCSTTPKRGALPVPFRRLLIKVASAGSWWILQTCHKQHFFRDRISNGIFVAAKD